MHGVQPLCQVKINKFAHDCWMQPLQQQQQAEHGLSSTVEGHVYCGGLKEG